MRSPGGQNLTDFEWICRIGYIDDCEPSVLTGMADKAAFFSAPWVTVTAINECGMIAEKTTSEIMVTIFLLMQFVIFPYKCQSFWKDSIPVYLP
jgi:hypothetical protein